MSGVNGSHLFSHISNSLILDLSQTLDESHVEFFLYGFESDSEPDVIRSSILRRFQSNMADTGPGDWPIADQNSRLFIMNNHYNKWFM